MSIRAPDSLGNRMGRYRLSSVRWELQDNPVLPD
jgi:hypothetical protein